MTPIFREDQRVRLKEFDNGDEIIPAQEGTLCEDVFELSDAVTCIVRLDEQYRDTENDWDGLREVTTDQLETVV